MKIIEILKEQLAIVRLVESSMAREWQSVIERVIAISQSTLTQQEIVRALYNEKTESTKGNVLDYLERVYLDNLKYVKDMSVPEVAISTKKKLNEIAYAFEEIFIFDKCPVLK